MAILQVYLPSMQVSGAKSVVEFGFRKPESSIGTIEVRHLCETYRDFGASQLAFIFLVTSLPLAFLYSSIPDPGSD